MTTLTEIDREWLRKRGYTVEELPVPATPPAGTLTDADREWLRSRGYPVMPAAPSLDGDVGLPPSPPPPPPGGGAPPPPGGLFQFLQDATRFPLPSPSRESLPGRAVEGLIAGMRSPFPGTGAEGTPFAPPNTPAEWAKHIFLDVPAYVGADIPLGPSALRRGFQGATRPVPPRLAPAARPAERVRTPLPDILPETFVREAAEAAPPPRVAPLIEEAPSQTARPEAASPHAPTGPSYQEFVRRINSGPPMTYGEELDFQVKILDELAPEELAQRMQAAGASRPDLLYQQLLSTGSRRPLRRGETWRERVLQFAAAEQEQAVPPPRAAPLIEEVPPRVPVTEPGAPEAGIQRGMLGVPDQEFRPEAPMVQGDLEGLRLQREGLGAVPEAAPSPPAPESPLESALVKLDEAQAKLEAASAPRGPAPKFGSKAAYDAEQSRKMASAEGRPIISKAQSMRQAKQDFAAAQNEVREQRNLAATRQMALLDAADASRPYPQEGPGSVETFARTSAAGQPPSPPVGISPSGEAMEGGYKEILRQFNAFLHGQQGADAWQQTLLARTQERARRAQGVRTRTDALVSQGVDAETAMNLSLRELAGELPSVKTPLHQLATPEVREALFQEVYLTLADDIFERTSTAEALANALAGKPIPRTPGVKGGSAYSRLVRVFGEDMTKTITQQRSLPEIIALQTRGGLGLSGYRPAPGPFISQPGTQGFGSRTFGAEQRPMLGAFEEPALLPPQQPLRPEPPVGQFANLAPDLRSPAERQLDLQRFRERTGEAVGPVGGPMPNMPDLPVLRNPPQPLIPEGPVGAFKPLAPDPRTQAQKQLDLQRFRERTGEAVGPVGGPMPNMPDLPVLRNPPQPLIPEGPVGAFKPLAPDPRTQAQKQLDLQIFKELTGEAPSPTGPSDPRTLAEMGIPPERIVRAPSMIPGPERARMVEWAKNIGLTTVDLGNLMRANVATVDLSYLRQQAFLLPGHPVAFAKSFRDALRGLWSAEYAKSIDDWIRHDPDYKFYVLAQQKHGRDFLRPLDARMGRNGKLLEDWQRAEEFIIKGGNRPLQKLADRIPWINVSSRAYITGMNSMNWHIYKGYLKTLHRQNEQIAAGLVKLKPLESFSIAKEADSLASMLADMSGRGPVGPLKELTPALNAGFFSLRTNIGRLISPRHLFSQDKWTRGEAWKNFLSGIGAMSAVILGGKQLGLWDVETDHRSSDYMKIILGGRIRIDPWGGYQQYAVLYGRLLPLVGGIKSTTTGAISDYDPSLAAARFVRSKASPMLSEAIMLWTGKDFIGRDIDRKDWKFWLKQNAPLSAQTIIDAFTAEGLVGLALAPLSVVGMGVQVHEESQNSVAHEMYGMDYDDLPEFQRSVVRWELTNRQTPEQRQKMQEAEAAQKNKTKEREAERRRQFQQNTWRRR